MSESVADRWRDDRTTFQRVYDVLVGTQNYQAAREFASRAACSETGAREALKQFVEMGIAERRAGRPVATDETTRVSRWRVVRGCCMRLQPAYNKSTRLE